MIGRQVSGYKKKRKKTVKPGDPKLAVAYMRVSTDTERQELGREAQRAEIEEWATREGVTICAWFTEEVTGGASLEERLVFLEALAAVLVYGAGVMVVQKLDRFSRDPVTAGLAEAELRKNGAVLAVAHGPGTGDDPTTEMIRTILFAFAKWEKAMIRARIRAALAVKKKRGEMTGAPPYGFRSVDGPLRTRHDGTVRAVQMLEVFPDEQSVIALVRALHAQGITLRAVASKLAADGFVGRRGKPFSPSAIHAMISVTSNESRDP